MIMIQQKSLQNSKKKEFLKGEKKKEKRNQIVKENWFEGKLLFVISFCVVGCQTEYLFLFM